MGLAKAQTARARELWDLVRVCVFCVLDCLCGNRAEERADLAGRDVAGGEISGVQGRRESFGGERDAVADEGVHRGRGRERHACELARAEGEGVKHDVALVRRVLVFEKLLDDGAARRKAVSAGAKCESMRWTYGAALRGLHATSAFSAAWRFRSNSVIS